MATVSVVFDLDGTLWDSRPWYEFLAEGISPGQGNAGNNAAKLLRNAGFTPLSFERACAESIIPLFEGVMGAIKELSASGVAMAAATNLPAWIALPMIKAAELDEFFPVVIDWGATSRHKPKPDPLLLAAKRLGMKPVDCWYVGDDPSDALAAVAAGMRFAWASWGYSESAPPATRSLKRPKDIALLKGRDVSGAAKIATEHSASASPSALMAP
jgi:HAD superfamily hydrolase (TIGR01509 family)